MNPFRTIAALLLVLAASAVLPALAPADTVTREIAKSPAAVRDYWTKARMRNAEPVPIEPAPAAQNTGPAADEGQGAPTFVPPAAPSTRSAPALERGTPAPRATRKKRRATLVDDPTKGGIRAHGKVFFTVKGGDDPGDFVCSGTVVNSRNKSLVWTAGHCVFDAEYGGGKSVNFVFVPAYGNGATPFGVWPATELATTREWKRFANLRYDMGTVRVAPRNGRRLQKVVGARGIGFDQPRAQNYNIFGYPALEPFSGELEYRCSSPKVGVDLPGGTGPKTIRVGCDMTGGSSGGGWITRKTLLSETSYGYGTSPYLYGPYLSQTAKKLYKRTQKP